MNSVSRRELLALMAAFGLAGPRSALAQEGRLAFAEPQPFSFDRLVEAARARAKHEYRTPRVNGSDILKTIDYDRHNEIRYREDRVIDVSGGKARLGLFHPGAYFPLPVTINLVEGETSREVLYRPDYFDMPANSPARKLPDDLGFAGFRVMDQASPRDWLAFLGAAYFRSSGELDQFGQSARALAIDVAMPTPEEFPRFTDFYFAGSPTGGDLAIYCSLDSQRVTGALSMDIRRDGKVVMDIEARYFAREDIERFGVAPLTSMFWFSETNREKADWRPEVHDTDGLELWTGAGERLWRPLNNPERVMTSSFSDDNPKGFGLMQRDRSFANYEDDGVFYEKRPSVWVEPRGDWGKGQVQLVEIPTDDEIHDNIVAYWLSAQPVKKGDKLSYSYRLHWGADQPYHADIGCAIATRIGRGGIPGQPRPPGVWKIVVDFAGGPVAALEKFDKKVEAAVSASSGEVSNISCYSNKATNSWRAMFDFAPAGDEPADLRLYMRKDGTPLSETWLYQFSPLRRTG